MVTARRSTPNVLVVEDNAILRDALSTVIEHEGYNVEAASNGQEALDRVAHGPPDAILLDMRMPILDGWGFARELCARGLRVPILVLTAERNAQQCAAEIGAEGYLGKPFAIAELLATLARLVD